MYCIRLNDALWSMDEFRIQYILENFMRSEFIIYSGALQFHNEIIMKRSIAKHEHDFPEKKTMDFMHFEEMKSFSFRIDMKLIGFYWCH